MRVAFVLERNKTAWLGGFVYLRNLIRAIKSNVDRKIEPVILCEPETSSAELSDFSCVEIIRTDLIKQKIATKRVSLGLKRFIGRDIALESMLKKNHIDVISHSASAGQRSSIISVGWIPDFQHLRMPQYFSREECRARDRAYRDIIATYHRVIVSSENSLNDLLCFDPNSAHKASVLRFVSVPDTGRVVVDIDKLRLNHGIHSPFFHLPNQFWAHKNHALVIEALSILKKRGSNVLVVSTGQTFDHRNPELFRTLMKKANDMGVLENFKVLGIVTDDELLTLQLNAIALINPSNFEGWSTTVEEAKSLGLRMILSDIPVHKEQAPPNGIYFKAGSSHDLADVLVRAISEHSPVTLRNTQRLAAARLAERVKQFGVEYEEILKQCYGT